MITIFQRIVLYMIILIAIYIFVKTSQFEINGRRILGLKYRILMAFFFPLILLIGILLSSFIIALILALGLIIFLYFKFFRKGKIKLILK